MLALVIMASSLAGAAFAAQNRPDRQILATCTACHGKDGNSAAALTPKVAGLKASYIAAQLEAFKSRARKSDAMSAVTASLTGQQIADLARYFSREPVHPDRLADARLAVRGKQIFFSRGGQGIPACAACHASQGFRGMSMMNGGMGGMGMMRNTVDAPNLGGQHADYVVQQLDAFASRARPATVMGPIAQRLGKEDRKAVAAYIASSR